ncbi:DUF3649 domain-containing protein [Polaromonas sp. SM01]|uniref:DUF3649 domain-containing protein n=1 Tax=Polaromonas sp. SM01 TaxID=3085630 RepID=UPI0029829A57|nr:DUF3649 domain-containing protein [Polaromonas sp. SM01]MDW5441944.1 DUF3649 domain-containing protein [Polaromonas sp. SM01]
MQPRCSAKAGYRLAVASRVLAAIAGGYALSALASAALALYLPGTRAEAALTANMAAFVIYTGAVMGVFAARTAARAWQGLLLAALLPGALLARHFWGGGAA